jgi:hypothetical protein
MKILGFYGSGHGSGEMLAFEQILLKPNFL